MFRFRDIYTIPLDEAKLKANERKEFGLPRQKKYPMPDRAHVLAC